MQLFYLYILKCADGSYYVGHTDDISRRMFEHTNAILYGYTAKRLPLELVYSEASESRDAVRAAERMIKGWSRVKKETLIKDGWKAMEHYCYKQKRKNKNINKE